MSGNLFSNIGKAFTRELHRMVKDPVYFIGTVVILTFSYVFFLTLLHEGQPEKMPVAVVDNDYSALSRQYIRTINATQQANVVMHAANFEEARKAMQKGNVYAIINIPRNFEADVYASRQPEISFYVNDAYLVAGSLLLKDITYVTRLTAGAIKQKTLLAKGFVHSQIMGMIQPISVDAHLIENPWVNYGIYLLNVILPTILQLVVLTMTIYSIGTELKHRTSKEWLQNSNNSFVAALTGKLLPYTILITLLGVIGDIILYKVMHYPMQKGITFMIFTTLLYVMAYQAMGILIIGITPVLRDGVTLTAIYGLLGVTMAGFAFPIEQMPYPLRILPELFPIRHYFKIYVSQGLYGLPIGYSIGQYLSLVTFLALPMFIFYRLKKAAIHQNYPVK